MASNPATNRSFSLIEIVIALAILAVGASIAVRFFPIGLTASRLSASITQAATLAQERIEEVKAQRALAPGSIEGDFTESGYPGFYYTQLTVEETDPEMYQRLFKVYLTVSWNYRGRTRSEEFITYISSR